MSNKCNLKYQNFLDCVISQLQIHMAESMHLQLHNLRFM